MKPLTIIVVIAPNPIHISRRNADTWASMLSRRFSAARLHSFSSIETRSSVIIIIIADGQLARLDVVGIGEVVFVEFLDFVGVFGYYAYAVFHHKTGKFLPVD